MTKVDLGALFAEIKPSSKKRVDEDLPSMFEVESVRGDTPPSVPSRINIGYNDSRAWMWCSSGESHDVPESVHGQLKVIFQGLRLPSGYYVRHVRWFGDAQFAVSSRSMRIFLRVRLVNDRHKTIMVGRLRRNIFKTLCDTWIKE
jgi:hypothetical protein